MEKNKQPLPKAGQIIEWEPPQAYKFICRIQRSVEYSGLMIVEICNPARSVYADKDKWKILE
mgnify:CR=1 FL=1